MQHVDTAAICGCVKRHASRVISHIAECSAFSYNFNSATRWEHCGIPLFNIVSLWFTTRISKHHISGTSPYSM